MGGDDRANGAAVREVVLRQEHGGVVPGQFPSWGSVVSLDEINEERGLYGGEGIPLSDWARTNELARERVSQWPTTPIRCQSPTRQSIRP